MNMQGGQPQQGHGMQPSAETDQIAANFNSEKGCINCLLMTGLICGAIGILFGIFIVVVLVTKSEWFAVIVFALAVVFEIGLWVVYLKMY